MEKPCIGCLVSACCSERCREYAKYSYETKQYAVAGEAVKKHIESMEYEDAIDHILMVEDTCLYIDNLP